MDKRTIPVIVGVDQFTQFPDNDMPLDPVSLMEKSCSSALNDTLNPAIKKSIDTVYMTNIFSWHYDNPIRLLSDKLGISPDSKLYPPIGGNTPQMFVNRAANAIASGKSGTILITGGESEYSVRKARKEKLEYNWPESRATSHIDGEYQMGTSSHENNYGIILPVHGYPFMESAVRDKAGRTPKAHLHHMAKSFSRLAGVAATNPYAWRKTAYSTEEIATATPENRLVAPPYTKRMIANIGVDQTAALIMTSQAEAERLSIPEDKWVYPMGGADLKNIFHMTNRPNLWDSPAITKAVQYALEQAGLRLDHIDLLDIYSCFPCMVEIACTAMGIEAGDQRDLTVTGGLPFFGGPFNNYSMHAICTMVDKIRKNPKQKGLVLANGEYNTKESVGIYGKDLPKKPWESERYDASMKALQQEIDSARLPDPVQNANGPLTIRAYLIHAVNGVPARLTVFGDLNNSERAFAEAAIFDREIKDIENLFLIGKTGTVSYNEETELNVIDLGSIHE